MSLSETFGQDEIEAARIALSRVDRALEKAHECTPAFTWWTKRPGFPGLVSLIVEQQISVVSAKAIFNRLERALGSIEPQAVLRVDVDQLRSFGLSFPKARYIHAIAEALVCGAVNLAEIAELNDEEACKRLLSLKGIGSWTAEAYLMGCEGRTDVFPAGDVALQEALRILDASPHRLTREQMYARAEAWRPYRSIAAQLLWGYYAAIKENTIVMPQGVPTVVKPATSSKTAA